MPQKVCIVSLDIIGPVKNGGVGTAMLSLAELLASNNHDVTILYPPAHTETEPLTYWIMEYKTRGIKFETLFLEENESRLSYAAYHWLKDKNFDVIHFHDMRGIGYWPMQAKKLGLAFQDTVLICQLHGQTYWHMTASSTFFGSVYELQLDYLEQKSVEFADVIYSPSRYMIDYDHSRGWQLPTNQIVRPNLLPASFYRQPETTVSADRVAIDELVFFGRLETRKGIELFCDALTRLQQGDIKPRLVTFLGKEGHAGLEPATAVISRASASWSFPYQILPNLDVTGANAYLTGNQCLAVIASSVENSPYSVLECIAKRVAFVASDVGGIAELIDPVDRTHVLFQRTPAALSEVLRSALVEGAVVARPAIDIHENRLRWLAWHEGLRPTPSTPAIASGHPLISICMAHFSRPHLLEIAIQSIRAQTYAPIELVLVDDASPDELTARYLDSLEPEFDRRGWKLIRNQTELWTGAARNKAVEHASGDYILLMDDDNVALPHEIATFVTAALHSGADVLTCQQQPFLSNDGPPPPNVTDTPWGWMALGPSVAQGFFENCLGDLNMFVRRDVWRQLGGFTEDPCGCEDYEFLLEAVLAGYHLVAVPDILFYYRHSENRLANKYDQAKLYSSFNRPLRPFLKRAPDFLRSILTFAANRPYHDMQRHRQGPWQERTPPDDATRKLTAARPGSGEALLELAKLAKARNQPESARRLYQQYLALYPAGHDQFLDE